tara:strand:- start:258 stop:470 length:213 start_codon:yes stop_codon:yes gene_type:complete
VALLLAKLVVSNLCMDSLTILCLSCGLLPRGVKPNWRFMLYPRGLAWDAVNGFIEADLRTSKLNKGCCGV